MFALYACSCIQFTKEDIGNAALTFLVLPCLVCLSSWLPLSTRSGWAVPTMPLGTTQSMGRRHFMLTTSVPGWALETPRPFGQGLATLAFFAGQSWLMPVEVRAPRGRACPSMAGIGGSVAAASKPCLPFGALNYLVLHTHTALAVICVVQCRVKHRPQYTFLWVLFLLLWLPLSLRLLTSEEDTVRVVAAIGHMLQRFLSSDIAIPGIAFFTSMVCSSVCGSLVIRGPLSTQMVRSVWFSSRMWCPFHPDEAKLWCLPKGLAPAGLTARVRTFVAYGCSTML